MSLTELPSGIANGVFCSLSHFSFFPDSQPYMSLFLQVLGFALILLYTFNVVMPLWRIHQGVPQTPELLIHPTVWLTTMVNTALQEPGLLPAAALRVGVGSVRTVGTCPSALQPFLSRALPPS